MRGVNFNFLIRQGADERVFFQLYQTPPYDVVNPDGSVTSMPGVLVDHSNYTFASQFRTTIDSPTAQLSLVDADFERVNVQELGGQGVIMHIGNVASGLMTSSGIYDIEARNKSNSEVLEVAYGEYSLARESTKNG